MTPAQITAAQAKAESWSNSNPFKKSLLSRLGGLHRPPSVADDRIVMAEEQAVALMRDYPAAVTEPTTEF